jgi:serine/threonine protein kinase
MQRKFEFVVHNPARHIRYYAERRLGVGGQGGVWAGHDSNGVPIALKVIWPTSNHWQAYWSWYNDQSAHLQCYNQPHVVRSYDQFISPEGWYVIVMEQASRTLDDVIRSGVRQSASRVCVIGTQVLSALAYFHSINRIHRDVSAQNLLEFADGAVKLNDFGISKALPSGEATGTRLGNAVYLPPELLHSGRWTHQSDIYQLGVVLISLLLGKHVIAPDASLEEMGKAIRDGIPRLAAEGLRGTHGHLATILAYMVCRTERLRFPNAVAAWQAIYDEHNRQTALEKSRRETLTNTLAGMQGRGTLQRALTAAP